MVDALGNPVGFFLTGGQAHDLAGTDHLLPDMKTDMLIADKVFDADKRVLEPLAATGKVAVMAWLKAGLHVKLSEAGLTLLGRMMTP